MRYHELLFWEVAKSSTTNGSGKWFMLVLKSDSGSWLTNNSQNRCLGLNFAPKYVHAHLANKLDRSYYNHKCMIRTIVKLIVFSFTEQSLPWRRFA